MDQSLPDPVKFWLEAQGFPQYAALFAENAIDAELLPTLSEDDLRSLGLPFGHARKLAMAAALLANPPAARPTTPAAISSPAERRQLTVMFCDLVGSTALSSRLDPEDLRAIIQAYQRTCGAIIERFGGFVAQYLGDGIMVYFGYPQAYEDAAERAVRSGLEIIAQADKIKTPGNEKLAVRIGAATGLAVVGDLIGRGASAQAAVIGQTPNLAARVQSLAEPGCMTIAESTRKLLGHQFEYHDLGPQHLKGIDEPVRVLQVLGERLASSRHENTRIDCVGRDQEIDFLLEKWGRARSGSGQVVLAWGEAGIGKSRLLRQLNQMLNAEEFTRIHIQCSPQHASSPLYPIISANQRGMGLRAEDAGPEKLAKLRDFLAPAQMEEQLPLLAAMMGVPLAGALPELALSAQEQKAQTLKMCVDFVTRLASRTPVLFQFEDGHWSDPTTRELLALLVAAVPAHRILLVVTGRPEFRPDWMNAPQIAPIDLGRLRETDIRMMVRSVAGKAMPESLVQQILDKTDGVPLFVEELTRTILEAGFLREVGESWVLDGPIPPMAIPLTLQDSLMARLDRLASAKEVTQEAAVIGRSFAYPLLAAVLDTPETTLQAALGRLIAAGLIYPRGELPDAEYSFKHAMIQEVAYESLLKSRRAVLHTRVVRALETHFPELVEAQPDLLAFHALRADLVDTGIEYSLLAARRAMKRSANHEAMQLLEEALTSVDRLDEKVRRARELSLQLALGQAALALYGFAAPATVAAFNRARELAEDINVPVQYYDMLYGLYASHSINGRLDLADEIAHSFLDRARKDEDAGYLCIGERMAGVVAFYRGRLAGSRTSMQQAMRLYDPASHRALALRFGTDVGVTVMNFLGCIDTMTGQHQRGMDQIENALTLALRLDHPLSVAQTLHMRCVTLAIVQDFPALLAASVATSTYCSEKNLGYFLFWANNFKTYAEAMSGNLRNFQAAREEMAALPELNQTAAVWWFHTWAAEILLQQNRPAEAAQELEQARTLIAHSDERWGQTEIARLECACLLAGQNPDPARAEAGLRAAVDLADRAEARVFALRCGVALCQLLADRGDLGAGRALLTKLCASFPADSSLPDYRRAQALLHG